MQMNWKKTIDNKEDMVPADWFEKTKIKGAVNAGLPKEMKDLKPEEKEEFLKTLGDNKDKSSYILWFGSLWKKPYGSSLSKRNWIYKCL